MANVAFYGGETVPLEMHKVRIVQKLSLPPVERRLEVINQAGNNTFLLQNADVPQEYRDSMRQVLRLLAQQAKLVLKGEDGDTAVTAA